MNPVVVRRSVRRHTTPTPLQMLLPIAITLSLVVGGMHRHAATINHDSVALLKMAFSGTLDAELGSRLQQKAVGERGSLRPSTLAYLRYLIISGQVRSAAAFLNDQPALLAEMQQSEFSMLQAPALLGELQLDEARRFAAEQRWTEAVFHYRQAIFRYGVAAATDDYLTVVAQLYAGMEAPEEQHKAALLLWQAGKPEQAVALLQAPSADDEADHQLIEADLLLNQGQIQHATDLLRAIDRQSGSAYLLAKLRLIDIGAESVDALLDEWQPTLTLAAPVDGIGQLQGVEVLYPTLVESGAVVPLLLLWQDVDTDIIFELSGNWYCRKRTCLQVLTAVNLIPDPGFEWQTQSHPSVGQLASYWRDDVLHTQPQDVWQVDPAIRQGYTTQAACLNNDAFDSGIGSSGISTRIRRIQQGKSYLQIGWVTSDGRPTNALLGRMYWLDGDEKMWSYMAGGAPAPEWRQHAAVTVAPDSVQLVDILAQNYQSPGKVCFDDLVFVLLN